MSSSSPFSHSSFYLHIVSKVFDVNKKVKNLKIFCGVDIRGASNDKKSIREKDGSDV